MESIKQRHHEEETGNHQPSTICFLVHGTILPIPKFQKPRTGGNPNADWLQENSLVSKTLQRTFGPKATLRTFNWSGWNRHRARLNAGSKLAQAVKESAENHPRARHVLIGHSHGGNVCTYAMRDSAAADATAAVVCIATPFLTGAEKPIPKWLRYVTIVALFEIFFLLGILILSAQDQRSIQNEPRTIQVETSPIEYELNGQIFRVEPGKMEIPDPNSSSGPDLDGFLFTVFMIVGTWLSYVFLRNRTKRRSAWIRENLGPIPNTKNLPSMLALATEGDEAYLYLNPLISLPKALRSLFQFHWPKLRFFLLVVGLVLLPIYGVLTSFGAASWISVLIYVVPVSILIGFFVVLVMIFLIFGVVRNSDLGVGERLFDTITSDVSIEIFPSSPWQTRRGSKQVIRRTKRGLRHCSLYDIDQAVELTARWIEKKVSENHHSESREDPQCDLQTFVIK